MVATVVPSAERRAGQAGARGVGRCARPVDAHLCFMPDQEQRLPAEEAPERRPPNHTPDQSGVWDDGGGQRTEVGHPYDGEGGVRRGVEREIHTDWPEKKGPRH